MLTFIPRLTTVQHVQDYVSFFGTQCILTLLLLMSTEVDIQGVSAVTCSSRRQKSPRQNDSQIVKYKNIFSTGQEVKKLFSTKRVK